jgi:hypothetical protein
METKWMRTCQECLHQQEDKEPGPNPANGYLNRKCKKCKSEGLDYGSYRDVDENGKIVYVKEEEYHDKDYI